MNRKTIKRWVENPWRIAKSLARRGLLDSISDKAYLSAMYRAAFGKKLNWDAPKTYNEKLQWLKLYDRNPIYCKMVDKYEAKQFVSDRIGSQYVVPILGGPWNSFEEIDFDALPEQFVLKTTHDCGGVVICEDKENFDHQTAECILQKHLKSNYYLSCREWPYKDIKPRIIAEKYLLDKKTEELRDYKFFCFDGVPKLMFIASERQTKDAETKFDFYDMEFHHLPISNGHPNSVNAPTRPYYFERMKEQAAVLSMGIPHVRVDFYECNGRLYFGDLTFFHWGGIVPFEPKEWDYKIGDWLVLPEKKEKSDE